MVTFAILDTFNLVLIPKSCFFLRLLTELLLVRIRQGSFFVENRFQLNEK